MAMEQSRMIERINDIIAIDIDAVESYQQAIERVDVEFLRMRLREFQQDHERHIRELSQIVQRMGGSPRTRPDIKGFLAKGFTAVTSMMGNEAALRAMQGNEVLSNRSYKTALGEDWSDDVRAIIERNYQDEQRHLAFIEDALRSRLWEQEQPAQP